MSHSRNQGGAKKKRSADNYAGKVTLHQELVWEDPKLAGEPKLSNQGWLLLRLLSIAVSKCLGLRKAVKLASCNKALVVCGERDTIPCGTLSPSPFPP